MFKTIIVLFLASLCVASTFAAMEGIVECKYIKAPLPTETDNSLCDKNPCTINNGAMVESTTTFKTPTSTSLTYNVDAYLGTFKIPIEFVPADQKDACKGLTSGACPVKEGDVVTHKVKLPVDAPMEATIHMEAYVTDQNKKPIFCYRTTVTVKDVV